MSVARVLQQLKAVPTGVATASNGQVLRIVCGNESADLDSVVCTVAYAYFSYINDPNSAVLPVVNIWRKDLALRRDVCHLLESHNITVDALFFREDLMQWKNASSYQLSCILVDHNDAPVSTRGVISTVEGIIDHHKDLGLHQQSISNSLGPRIIQTTGSCSSLVFKFWYDTLKSKEQDTGLIADVVPLLLGALLIDTDNMKHKVELLDIQVFEQYKRVLGESFDTDALYEELRRAKDDINGLSLYDIIRKDYKEFHFGQNLRCGIGSVVKSIGWLAEKFDREQLENACEGYLLERQLDIFVLMTSFVEGGVFTKQIAFHTSPSKLHLEKALIDDLSQKLDLVELPELSSESIKCFNQRNTKASRKQVAPFIEDFIVGNNY